eukprot:13408921-Ditylum_brightwellii.AAC.1
MDGAGNYLGDADNNMDDFLLSSLEPDLELSEDDDIGNNNYVASRYNDNNLDQYVDTIQTISAGEYSMEIDHETEYSGTFGNIKISGNQGQQLPSCFLQKLVATCYGSSIPLMYPE